MTDYIQAIISSSTGNELFIPIILIVAFFAGIIASLSPCSLGVLPLIIGYVGGYSKEGNKKLLIQMFSFSLGLSFILSILGAICALSGKAFTGITSPVVLLIFASVITILGLNLIGFIDIHFPALVKKMPQNKTGSMFVFPFLIGALFSLAASPCSSPLLASIMAFAAISRSIILSVILLFLFALGQCVIIIFFALFTSALKHLNFIAKYSELLIKLSGIILILAGLYIYYVIFSDVLYF